MFVFLKCCTDISVHSFIHRNICTKGWLWKGTVLLVDMVTQLFYICTCHTEHVTAAKGGQGMDGGVITHTHTDTHTYKQHTHTHTLFRSERILIYCSDVIRTLRHSLYLERCEIPTSVRR